MLSDKVIPEDPKGLIAYISEERDREMNTYFLAAICDSEKDILLTEKSDYDRDALILAVSSQYPGIEIQTA